MATEKQLAFPVGSAVIGRAPNSGAEYNATVTRYTETGKIVTTDAEGKERTAPPGLLRKV